MREKMRACRLLYDMTRIAESFAIVLCNGNENDYGYQVLCIVRGSDGVHREFTEEDPRHGIHTKIFEGLSTSDQELMQRFFAQTYTQEEGMAESGMFARVAHVYCGINMCKEVFDQHMNEMQFQLMKEDAMMAMRKPGVSKREKKKWKTIISRVDELQHLMQRRVGLESMYGSGVKRGQTSKAMHQAMQLRVECIKRSCNLQQPDE